MGSMGGGKGLEGAGARVLVLGGAGFVGRHAVAALLEAGAEVSIGSRHPARIDRRLPPAARTCARRLVRLEAMTNPAAWRESLGGIDVVVNCVGILRQRGRETYERVHHLAPAALAEGCRRSGLRLLHVSALGLDANARSRFLRSKHRGEQALRASGADCCIVRPSLLDGEGGFGARWLRRLARLPLHPLPADATGRIAALDVCELGEALAVLALRPSPGGVCEVELGGMQPLTLSEYVAALRRLHTPRPARMIPVPGPLARIGSHLCDLLHFSPFSFGHWELLRTDNCPHPNMLPELLGRPPRAVGAPVPCPPAPASQAQPV